jgi:hypothetical protein
VTRRHERTELVWYANLLWDEIKGALGRIDDTEPEASEAIRRDIVVVMEILAGEAKEARRLSRLKLRSRLYGPGAEGRILAALGIPPEHRTWLRLGRMNSRAVEAKIRAALARKERNERRRRAIAQAAAEASARFDMEEGPASTGFTQVVPE